MAFGLLVLRLLKVYLGVHVEAKERAPKMELGLVRDITSQIKSDGVRGSDPGHAHRLICRLADAVDALAEEVERLSGLHDQHNGHSVPHVMGELVAEIDGSLNASGRAGFG